MSEYQYDLFVIGAGSGGVRAARMSADLGAKVAIAENRYLGGTCVNLGCVPKKLFMYASHFAEDFENAKGFGWNVGAPEFNWKTLLSNKNLEINRLNSVYQRILDNAGVETKLGHGKIIDEHTVQVGNDTFTSERILIATGGWPSIPDIPGKEHIISSNEAFYLESLPEKVIVVGGGYIAVEFAGIFHGLGVDTTLLYRGDLFLRGFDYDLRETLADEMTKKNINMQFNANISTIEKEGEQLIATLEDGSKLEAGKIMYATGRIPMTENLGLENVNITLDKKGAIVVNEEYQTNVPSIYAIGDVTDRVQLTPVALAEGIVLARRLYTGQDGDVDYSDIPTCVFSQPNLGTVGLTEEEARAKYGEIDIYKSTFKPMKLSLTDSDEKTLMKLIVDKASDKVVGVHMLGPDAGEIIQGIGIAMKAGATKKVFDSTIGIHPTAAEEFVTMQNPVKQ